jgi:hypothetical protein
MALSLDGHTSDANKCYWLDLSNGNTDHFHGIGANRRLHLQ